MTGQEMLTWGSSMRWVLRLIETGMSSGVAGVDVMEISRPDGASNIADLGLTLSEAKQLLARVQQGTGAKLGVRRQQRLAGMSRWLDGISVRIRRRAYHYRPRTEPEAVGRRRAVTSAFADFCSSGGSPRNWLSLL